jgi:hypothetical protein
MSCLHLLRAEVEETKGAESVVDCYNNHIPAEKRGKEERPTCP